MSKNKKKFLSVLLAFAMLCSIVSPAWAEVPRSDTGYYALENAERGQVYIESIAMADNVKQRFFEEGDLETWAKQDLQRYLNDLGGYLDKDLNDNAGGNFIYLGWNGTTDPNEAITGLRLLGLDNDEQPPASYEEGGVTWNLQTGAVFVSIIDRGWLGPSYGLAWSDSEVDLNDGAGGDYIYLYYTKDPSYGPPIQEIRATEDDTVTLDNYLDKVVRFGDGKWYDVNAGAGGDYIYLYTMTGLQPVDIPELRELTEAAEECLNDSERYTDIRALESAYESGKATLEAWGDDKYYTEDTSMQARVDTNIRALQSALDALSVNDNIGSGNGDNNTDDSDNNDGITKPEWPGFDNIDQEMWNKWWSYSSQWWKQWSDYYDWSDYADWCDKYNWSDLSDWYNLYRK